MRGQPIKHPTKLRSCLQCSKIMERPIRPKNIYRISWYAYSKRIFCSNKCRFQWHKNHINGSNNPHWLGGKPLCIDCKKKLSYHYQTGKRCKSCWSKAQTGKNNSNWRGGKKIDKTGYILIHKPNHPFSNSQGYVREHRLVAEKCLSRYLKKTEVVHHINKVKSDNRVENLFLFQSNSEHRICENKPLVSNLS